MNCKYKYCLYGLNVESEVICPQLPISEAEVFKPDVHVTIGIVPDTLKDPIVKGFKFQAKENMILFKTRRIADFLVSNGNRIVVQPRNGSNENEVRLLLLGWVFGALLHQREILPLHGSAIKVGSECVIFCGNAGNGKSSIARSLLYRGYRLLDDNISAVSVSNNGIPIVYPGYPEIKLFRDIMEKYEDNLTEHRRIRPELDKFSLSFSDRFYNKPLPLKKIYLLANHSKPDIEILPATGSEKFHSLRNSTFCYNFVKGLGRELSNFRAVYTLGTKIPLIHVRRPYNPFPLDELADLLEKDFLI